MDRAGVGFRMVHARCVCVVSGWFMRVAFVAHFVSVVIIPAPPQTSRHQITEAEDLGAPARDHGFLIFSRCRGPSDSWLTLKAPVSEWFQMCEIQRKRKRVTLVMLSAWRHPEAAGFSSSDGEFRMPLGLAQGSQMFHSSCEGKLGIALE